MKEKYKELEQTIYGPGVPDDTRELARFELVYQSTEHALGVFARKNDAIGLKYISMNPGISPQLRRNAYMERGIEISVEEIEAGMAPGYNVETSGGDRPKLSIEDKRIKSKREIRYERFEKEKSNARELREEYGISEEDFNRWLEETQRPSVFRVDTLVDRFGDEMSGPQANAVRALEGDW